MKLLVAGHDDVSRFLDMATCIDLMADTFAARERGEVVWPLRGAMLHPDHRGLIAWMPGYMGNLGVSGAKLISVFDDNTETLYDSHQGSVLVFETEHGRLLAVVDAGRITAIRTAAVSGLATRLLAPPEAVDLALLGAGIQASAHLEAMIRVRPIERVRVWNRTRERAERFAERESRRHGLPVEVCADAEGAVRGAQIVCTATAARSPILEGRWLSPGAHVNAVGSSSVGFRELDTQAVARSRLFVDARESALREADDFRIPRSEGAITDSHIVAELGEVVCGRSPGRTSPQDVTVFKSLGLAIEDLAAAYHVYHRAVDLGEGTWMEFSGLRED